MLLVIGLVLAWMYPADRMRVVMMVVESAFLSPLAVAVGYAANRRARGFGSIFCRLRSYAVAAPLPVLVWFLLPPL